MKKVISFSMWGKNPFYIIGGILNADIAQKEWDGWICRYYVAPTVPKAAVKELAGRKNTEIFMMDEDVSWNGMFWRFYPASDPTVDVMISRDTDSRLSVRDKAAVDQWLASDKDFHILRDCCQHGWPICGGAWGCRNGVISEMVDLIDEYPRKNIDNNHGIDQKFLGSEIYPRVINNTYVHDDWFAGMYRNETKHAFPIPRLRGDGWWNTKFPEWHSGIENNQEKYPHWFGAGMPGHCYLRCPACGVQHDNDYIGKLRYVTEQEKQTYIHVLNECSS